MEETVYVELNDALQKLIDFVTSGEMSDSVSFLSDKEKSTYMSALGMAGCIISARCKKFYVQPTEPTVKAYWKPVTCREMYGGEPEAWYSHGDPIACHLCSNCNGYPLFDDSGEEYLSDFCPNCGADMRVE